MPCAGGILCPCPSTPCICHLLLACRKYNIPTAQYETFTDPAAAKAFITQCGAPIVVKTSGLAAGKGVIVAQTLEEAYAAVDDMMLKNAFGDAGGVVQVSAQHGWSLGGGEGARRWGMLASCSDAWGTVVEHVVPLTHPSPGCSLPGTTVVVEEFLDGEEASFFAFIDGENCTPLVGAQVRGMEPRQGLPHAQAPERAASLGRNTLPRHEAGLSLGRCSWTFRPFRVPWLALC